MSIEYVKVDLNETANNIITVYEGLTGRTLYPADPVRLFLMSLATIITQQRALINKTAKSNLLRYALDDKLDAMGEFMETKRLTAQPASTTLEFRLSIPLTSATIINAGTMVGPQGGDGQLYFFTDEVLEIPAGQITGRVSASCSIPGTAGNGFLPDQINMLISPLPFVQSVSNVTESAGGSDEESNDAYRERIRTAPESFSTAGPDEAYAYWAKTANASIIDVGVDSPADGEVKIVPLMMGGELPEQEVLEAVKDAVSDRKRRPLTDKVTVAAPATTEYNITLTYWIDRSLAADTTAIQAAVTAAVDQYRIWQKSKLGRDINPSELIWRVMAAGALRVNVTEPTYLEVDKLQVAQDATVNVTFGGLADD